MDVDILNERDEEWNDRDWDDMPWDAVQTIAEGTVRQVGGLLDSKHVFTEAEGDRLVRRIMGQVAWACRKHDRGPLSRQLDTIARNVAKRAHVEIPRLYRL